MVGPGPLGTERLWESESQEYFEHSVTFWLLVAQRVGVREQWGKGGRELSRGQETKDRA